MRLLIVSDMAHYRRRGEIVGWGPTVQEIDHLARLFDQVVHVASLYEAEAPISALPYTARNIHLVALPPSGGNRFSHKLNVLRLYPHYARVILASLQGVDVVHVRCPANVSMLAALLLAFRRYPKKRWIKYGGSWQHYDGEAWSYRFQRWFLEKDWTGAEVTVNGRWEGQPRHVLSFANPCLSGKEIEVGRRIAEGKTLGSPLRLLYVGRLEASKGVGRILPILERLDRRQVHCAMDLIGDGPERSKLEAEAAARGIRTLVTFHGMKPRSELAKHYAQAHLLLFPSASEGWPKVLSEGMAYGVVPVSSAVGSIPQYLKQFSTGRAIAPTDLDAFADAIANYAAHPDMWKQEATNAVQEVDQFSYTSYLHAVQSMLGFE